MNAGQLRASFPLLRRVAYLNAGTCGPIPEAAIAAATGEVQTAAQQGRAGEYFAWMGRLQARQREAYAARLGAEPQDVALTSSTSDGIVRVLTGLHLQPGDDVVTSDEEHPGLLGPLAAARHRLGIRVRTVPFARLAEAVGVRTALVACSHVSWINGSVAPAELRDTGVPVLLDGAQGVGAIGVNVRRLGCAFYAGSGQKWLCGPIGTGMLYVHPEWQERLSPIGPTYTNLETPADGLDALPWGDARAYDAPALSAEASAAAFTAHDVIHEFGWREAHERATGLAAVLARALRERGVTVAPRGETTLVSWEVADPAGTRARLAEKGVIVRDLPGTPYLRASLGAWNDERDLERLLSSL